MVMAAATKPLVLENLSKRYAGSPVFAIKDISLSVASGEVYGFLGANGAGKSTTIRTLLNFVQPTAGSARIAGFDIVADSVQAKRHTGYLAGEVALYDKLTGRQFLHFMAELQPPRDHSYPQHLSQVFQAELDKPLRTLSRGNRQKIGIIQACMHQPDILILDEPTTGLDPLMQEVFFDVVRETKKRGGCVFFSSHNLAEVQRACDRVGFIRDGKLVREHTLSDMSAKAANSFDLVFQNNAPLQDLKRVPQAQVTSGGGPHRVTVAVPSASLPLFFAVLSQHRLSHFQQREANLEEEFLSYYQEDQRD